MKSAEIIFGKKSIRSYMIIIFVCMAIVVLTGVFIYNQYVIRLISDQVIGARRDTMYFHGREIDDSMNEINKFLISIGLDTPTLSRIAQGGQSEPVLLAKQKIGNDLSKGIGSYSNLTGLFFYSPVDQYFIYRSQQSNTLFRKKLSSHLSSSDTSPAEIWGGEKWEIIYIEEKPYLMKSYIFSEMIVGAWIDLSDLEKYMNRDFTDQGSFYIFLDQDGYPIQYLNSNLNKIHRKFPVEIDKNYIDLKEYVLFSIPLKCENIYLTEVLEKNFLLGGLVKQRVIFLIIVITFTGFFFFFLTILKNKVGNPLYEICRQMDEDHTVDSPHKPDTKNELVVIHTTYHEMKKELLELRIDIYEEKLYNQKIKLQFLQKQIQPHFLVNSLNMVHNLIQLHQCDLAQQLLIYIANYYREDLTIFNQMIPLKNEYEHVNSYVHIQEFRFPNNLLVNIEIDEELLDIKVPPLILLTLVENSVKYAVNMEKLVEINILGYTESEGCAKFIVMDTGKGYPESVLTEFE